jgi:hypothetical protein
MPTELNTNANANDMTKKLWEVHQKDEYTRVSNYKEAVCLGCLKKDVAAATIADICEDCASKKGREPLLATVTTKLYGLCFFCAHYKFGIEQVNGRFCKTCHDRIARVTKEYNKKGGMMYTDPYWIAMRKKHGKDWKQIMSSGSSNYRR